MVNQRRTWRPEPLGRGIVRVGAELAVPAAGIVVFVLGRVFGEDTVGRDFWAGVLAMAGTLGLLHPRVLFGWETPRWRFAGSRPEPSAACLWSTRIGGAVALVASILVVLFVSEPVDPVVPAPYSSW
ncbi:hypothetical protein [Actinokineospora sp.]|uniref:hypothetical protein n=1 Tax=Actinokineospora sp. TaxID=1872133 RepID=UPI004037DC30